MGRPFGKEESTTHRIQAGARLAEGTIVGSVATMVLLHVFARLAGGVVVMYGDLFCPALYLG